MTEKATLLIPDEILWQINEKVQVT